MPIASMGLPRPKLIVRTPPLYGMGMNLACLITALASHVASRNIERWSSRTMAAAFLPSMQWRPQMIEARNPSEPRITARHVRRNAKLGRR